MRGTESCTASAPTEMLVVGGDSRIGAELMRHLSAAGLPAVGTSRRSPAGPDRLALNLEAPPSTWVLPRVGAAILLAAVTSTALCEAEPERTRAVNVTAMFDLGRMLAARGAHLVLLSTNLVLSGREPSQAATSPLMPQGAYASQKAELEARLQVEGIPVSILRVGKIADSLEPMLRGWARHLSAGEPIRPIHDLVCAPVPLATVIEAITGLATRRLPGLFQLTGDRDLGYDVLASRLARRMGVRAGLVQPIPAAEAGLVLAGRGPCTTLDTAATLAALALPPISSLDTVDRVVEGVVGPLA